MGCSDSSSLRPEQTLSLIIGSNGSSDTVRDCLSALEDQRDGIEVVVCEPAASPPSLRRRFDWARFIEHPGAPVPVLWSEGIARSTGQAVALTISPMRPAPDWVATVSALLRRHDVVAGAIEPARGLRVRDWAEYLCRYTPDMLPFSAHRCAALPGDNCAYRRDVLDGVADLYREGFWEPVVNGALAADGVELWHVPELVVRQGRSAGTVAFLRQRLIHGSAHGRQRGQNYSLLRNLGGIGGAPIVPLLLTLRILRQVASRPGRWLPALAALPLVLAYNAAWAIGEARGHLRALSGT